MDEQRTRLIKYTVDLVEQLYHLVGPSLPEEWLSLDLTLRELRVLLLLFTYGPRRMGMLADSAGIALSTATSAVDHLVERGLVFRNRDRDDRRSVICSLTPKGQELARRLWELGRLEVQGLLELLPEDQLERVAEAMEFLYEAAESKAREEGGTVEGLPTDL